MRVLVLLFQIWFLTAFMAPQSSAPTLEGCPAPNKIGIQLGRLQHRNWRTVSAQGIVKSWPSPLDDVACESSKSSNGCRLLVSKERIIGGHCECCEMFAFDVERASGESSVEHLNDVVVHYSAATKGQAIDAAKLLAEAIGLPKPDIAKIGDDSVQRYEWKDTQEDLGQSYLLELQFSQQEHHWELYLSLAADNL